jgi:hypothetical protein
MEERFTEDMDSDEGSGWDTPRLPGDDQQEKSVRPEETVQPVQPVQPVKPVKPSQAAEMDSKAQAVLSSKKESDLNKLTFQVTGIVSMQVCCGVNLVLALWGATAISNLYLFYYVYLCNLYYYVYVPMQFILLCVPMQFILLCVPM